MAKYLVETYYTCTFKVNHYLDDINETELKNLEKRDDGKFEVLDVKLDNRKTKSLDPNNKKIINNKKIDSIPETNEQSSKNLENFIKSSNNATIKELQNSVWGYSSNLETHTVETHIYRLRKKMSEVFGDDKFIENIEHGYKIS